MIVYKKFIESSFEAVDDAVMEMDAFFENECGHLNEHDLFKIKFMIREMLNNGVEHGNHFNPDLKVGCIIHYEEPHFIFEFFDEGPGIEIANEIIPGPDDSPLRTRQRGYQTIIEMGFNIQIIENQIRVLYTTGQEVDI